MNPQITLDFGNTTADGLIYARTARASEPVEVGVDLLAVDGDGNTCTVRVIRINGPIAYMRADFNTWQDGPVTTVHAMVDDYRDVDAVNAGNGHGTVSSANGTNLVPEPVLA